mmetsp:Transcript_24250/g.29377  ORF Transcript_24250/g.29377 Transcript_24250/m.29377 type:complete len:97 (+) Transcript_24250:336-626(+)
MMMEFVGYSHSPLIYLRYGCTFNQKHRFPRVMGEQTNNGRCTAVATGEFKLKTERETSRLASRSEGNVRHQDYLFTRTVKAMQVQYQRVLPLTVTQ